MAKIKKRDRARTIFNMNHDLFRCPVCKGQMLRTDAYGLNCSAGHNFDLARKGYVNLLTRGQNCVYDTELFQARRQVFRAGLFGPLIAKVSEVINELSFDKRITLLDVGCGEGSFLCSLVKQITQMPVTPLGIDISKEGINLAASYNDPLMWCVADLAQLPLQDASIDIILNVLSPANYGEFHRVLKARGVVVKVIPGQHYLGELRDFLRYDQDHDRYSNEEVIKHLEENLEIQAIHPVHYRFMVNSSLWPHLVRMTPLMWNKSIHEDLSVSDKEIKQVTVDLNIIVGSVPDSSGGPSRKGIIN